MVPLCRHRTLSMLLVLAALLHAPPFATLSVCSVGFGGLQILTSVQKR